MSAFDLFYKMNTEIKLKAIEITNIETQISEHLTVIFKDSNCKIEIEEHEAYEYNINCGIQKFYSHINDCQLDMFDEFFPGIKNEFKCDGSPIKGSRTASMSKEKLFKLIAVESLFCHAITRYHQVNLLIFTHQLKAIAKNDKKNECIKKHVERFIDLGKLILAAHNTLEDIKRIVAKDCKAIFQVCTNSNMAEDKMMKDVLYSTIGISPVVAAKELGDIFYGLK